MSIKIGKSKFGNGRKDFKIKKDEPLTARIIPPIGDLADKGKYAVYHAVEWGYKGTDGRMKPFLDVHEVNRKTKMVEVQSAAYTRRDALKKNHETLSAAFKAGTASKEDLDTATSLVRQYNLDKKFYLNIKTLTGELGVLKINYKMYQALKAQIDRLVKLGVDPTSVDNGRFFTFSSTNATGALQDWMFTVDEYKENVKTEEYGVVQKEVVDILSEEVISRLGTECAELNKLYKSVTAADVARFVSEGPVAVDEILGTNTNAKAETAVAQRSEAVASDNTVAEKLPEPTPVETAPVAETITAPVETAPVETTPAAAVPESLVANQSQADADLAYLKKIGAM